jgi:hypothetical protein
MIILNNLAMQALFRLVCGNGTECLFLVGSDDRWLITRNGDRVASGMGTSASVNSGVARFRSFAPVTTRVPGRPTDDEIVFRGSRALGEGERCSELGELEEGSGNDER